jgi:hypothetical protein
LAFHCNLTAFFQPELTKNNLNPIQAKDDVGLN